MATARFDGRENYAAGDYARETGPRALQFAHDTADSTRLDSLFPRRDSSPPSSQTNLPPGSEFFLPSSMERFNVFQEFSSLIN